MKKFILSLSAMLLFTTVFAQNEKEATALLDKAIALFEKGGVEMNGVVRYGDGAFALSLKMDHERFHADVADFELWFDNKTQWFLRSEEIYISEPTPEEQNMNPYLMMKNAKKQFNVSTVDSKLLPKGATAGLKLTPRNYSELQEAKLFFDKDNRLVSMQAYLQNGNQANVDITSFKNGLKFDAKDFTCNTKDFDAEVIDMR